MFACGCKFSTAFFVSLRTTLAKHYFRLDFAQEEKECLILFLACFQLLHRTCYNYILLSSSRSSFTLCADELFTFNVADRSSSFSIRKAFSRNMTGFSEKRCNAFSFGRGSAHALLQSCNRNSFTEVI